MMLLYNIIIMLDILIRSSRFFSQSSRKRPWPDNNNNVITSRIGQDKRDVAYIIVITQDGPEYSFCGKKKNCDLH